MAARIGCRTFMKSYRRRERGTAIPRRLRDALDAAYEAVIHQTERDGEFDGSGTGLTAAAVTAGGVHWISTSGPRIYVWRWRTGRLQRLNERQNRRRRESPYLDTAIPLIDASDEAVAVETDDALILATNGLGSLTDNEVGDLAARSSVQNYRTLAEELVSAATERKRDWQDDVTAVTLRIDTEDPGEDAAQ